MNTLPLLGAALGALVATGVPAQDEELIAKRDKKLESHFLAQADWITDYDAARATARKTKKPIFAYFTRSYAP